MSEEATPRLRQNMERILLLSIGLLVLAGCATPPAAVMPLPEAKPKDVEFERYYEVWLGQSKIGYARTVERRVGNEIHTTETMLMRVKRGWATVEARESVFYAESLSGEPLRATFITRISSTTITRTAVVGEEKVEIEENGIFGRRKRTLPRDPDLLFPAAIRRKTAEACRRGEGSIRYKSLSASLTGVTYSTMESRFAGPAKIDVMGGQRPAMKFTQVTRRGRQKMSGTEYVDTEGRMLMLVAPAEGIRMVAASASVAQAMGKPADLLNMMLLKAKGAPPAEKGPLRLAIRTHAQEPGKATAFAIPQTAGQKIVKSSPGYIELILSRDIAPPKRSYNLPYKGPGMRPFLASTAYLASDDQAVVGAANKAVAGEKDAFRAAQKLRTWVYDNIKKKSLDVGFAPASEVARQLKGDCTEHAVLLAAMGRSVGLPSRLVIGLAYVEEFAGRKHVFGYHMWTQFHVGEWVDFDAALKGGFAGSPHIALAFVNLVTGEPPDAFLPVLRFIHSQPQITFLSADGPEGD